MVPAHRVRIARRLLLVSAVLALAGATLAAPADADPNGVTISASCLFQRTPTGTAVPDGATIVVAPGDYLKLRLSYEAKDTGSPDIYVVDFTSTLAANPLTGATHVVDTAQRYGGGGYSTGGIKDYVFDTSSWATGTSGILSVAITSTFTDGRTLATCSTTVLVRAPNGDEDGDGLFNSWETTGIDANGDGTVDLTLPGANPLHKDLYVEVDWMDCSNNACDVSGGFARPTHDSAVGIVDPVTQAFAVAPKSNPDGADGVDLHITVDESVPGHRSTLFGPERLGNGSHDATFDEIKSGDTQQPCDGHFGTSGDRVLSSCAAVLAARKMAYRYAVVGSSIADGASVVSPVGIAEIGGNDFFVTADWSQPASITTDADTFMHELGHTLGLHHGGADDLNCKPNYLSIMNYPLSWAKFAADKFPLDYSRQKLATLNEASLSEPAGVGNAAPRWTKWGINGKEVSAEAQGPLDFNGDNDTTDTAIAADLNHLDSWGTCKASPGQSLEGHDDWADIDFNFRDSTDYADLTHGTSVDLGEPTFQELTAHTDTDGDGVPDTTDNCPSIINGGQYNRDLDTPGDACDPDSDPPTITVTTPLANASYLLRQVVNAAYSCTDEPGGSGLATCVGTVASGAPLDTGTVGAPQFTVTATDNDAHRTQTAITYWVGYTFAGFAQPVDNGGVFNIATAGRTIPLKWRLTDAAGGPITTLAAATVTTIRVPCATTGATDAVETYAASTSGLLNLGDGTYQLNWQTPKSLAGTCQQMRLDLGEGQPHTALFAFTR
jgi:hypothetical protein